MKVLVILSCLLAAVTCTEYCYNDIVSGCAGKGVDLLKNCNAKYGGAHEVMFHMQSYANSHIARSFEYLLMSTHFGNYEKNREGFEKLFRQLSDSKWEDAIDLIKYITKRGGKMNFSARKPTSDEPAEKTFELYEIDALARSLDTEKTLAEEGHGIHREVIRRHEGHHDPEVSSYLEEHFMHSQAKKIRELAGYTNDLKRLLSESKPGKEDKQSSPSLALFLFDEYLQKVL